MQELLRNKKAQQIRDVIRYLQKFNHAIVVIYIDDEIINSSLFSSHMRDISLLHQAGLKVVIVPGSRKRIDQILTESNISWKYNNNIRITKEDAIPQIKMAAFDISNIIMTSLAANHITATIGNWVRARAKGVINGVDYGTAGEIDKIQIDAIKNTLDNGFIPIFPCIGWSSIGKPYNISSITLAEEIAINLKADKLFFLMMNEKISNTNFDIPSSIGLSEEGEIPAMNIAELDLFLESNKNSDNNKIISLLNTAKNACQNGVTRTHILNGSYDGALPCEIFSDLGSGTMIYSENYGKVRPMTQQDIPSVLSIMNPFIKKQILLPRTEDELLTQINDFITYEIDECVCACAALHIYNNQAEIAAVAVDETYSHLGIGPKMINYLISKAKKLNLKSIFILTTQSADWFEKLGFQNDVIDSLPSERKKLWNSKRNSKVYRLEI